MSITNRKWTEKADSLANEYHNSRSNVDRDRIKAEWYAECGRIAAQIESHSTFQKKNKKNFLKNKKVLSIVSKEKNQISD